MKKGKRLYFSSTDLEESNFVVDNIISNASSLKYTKEINEVFNNELSEPSYEFVRLFAS
jgi:hypothetical protein